MTKTRNDQDREATPKKPKKPRTPIVIRLARVLVILGLIVAIAKVGGCANRLFYYPVTGTYPTHPRAEDVRFTNEGRSLHGWWFPARNPDDPQQLAQTPAPTIVFCHGNAFNIERHTPFMDFLPQRGFNVFIFDYRSYGMSDRGPLHRDGLIHDAGAAIDYVFSRDDIDPERIGLYGMSLGGNIALAAAAEDPRVASVCSVATFSRWERVAGDFLPVLGPWLVSPGRDATDTAAALGDRPLRIIHGSADPIVRAYHAPIIHDAATAAGVDSELLVFQDATHTDWVEKHPDMRDAIGDFFERTLRNAQTTPTP